MIFIKNKALNCVKYIVCVVLFATITLKSYGSKLPLIFPIPQDQQLTSELFKVDEQVSILVPQKATPHDLFLARFLVREFSDKYGIALKIESSNQIPTNRKVMVMGTLGNPLINDYCKKRNIQINQNSPGKEGYILNVNANLILIGGFDDSGSFFGLQSLRQLLIASKGKTVQGLKVRDWPSLPFRAIRLYAPGPDQIAFFKRFLRDFMSLYKYNKVILELNGMRLDKHPEVNTGWVEFAKYMQYSRSNSTVGLKGEEKNSSHFDSADGKILEKEDVADLVKIANQNFIEVIPEIPSLTHGYYLLTKHPELAEYPGDKWPDTYCPSNPKSYELLFDVYDEYLAVIKPKMVHIGHDEWWGAPIDACPRCKGKDYAALFASDVNKVHSYLAKKGIKAAMWGDYLLESVREKGVQNRTSSTGVKYQTPGALPEALVRAEIPKDILIFNWFWIDEEKEAALNNMGFKQLYGNFTPNISNWDSRIKKIDLAGGAPSSWAATNQINFGKDIMLDFLGCANLLWSKHTINEIDLPLMVWNLMPSIRTNLNVAAVPSEDGDEILPIDISKFYNQNKDIKAFELDLNDLSNGWVSHKQKQFNLQNRNSPNKHIVTVSTTGKGENPFPKKVEGIAINEDVSSLIFLHAAAKQAANQKAYFNIPNMFDSADLLGYYEVVYEDGFKSIIPIQYGVNILEWNPGGEKSLDKREGDTGSPQLAYAYQADPVNCSINKDKPITFFSFEWVNPRFGKVIKEVNLLGTVNYQALQQDYGTPITEPMDSNGILLLAISKVQKRAPFAPTK